MEPYHVSVMREKVLEYLNVRLDEQYIDATLGGGGHTEEIVKLGGEVLGIDQDEEALTFVQEKLGEEKKITLVQGNFRDIATIAKSNGFEHVSGILFDLGVSSHQLDTPERGFSFQRSGPLDMRMSAALSVSARDLVNGLTKQELSDLLFKLGEEYQARTVAQAIVQAREKKPIETTEELEKIVRHAIGSRATAVHPATKTFQALRIAVNDEMRSLSDALPKALSLLKNEGRMVVISFHSLEDRIVKNSFKEFAHKNLGTILTEKPLVAGDEEVQANPRSRSAKLRVFERIL